jgi:alkylation response protein AidB-like acyl-CoA dehydrogenase
MAQKRFASGLARGRSGADHAPFDDPQDGAQVLQFAVPVKSEGIRSNDDWNTLGLRATGSHTLAFENVLEPDAADR